VAGGTRVGRGAPALRLPAAQHGPLHRPARQQSGASAGRYAALGHHRSRSAPPPRSAAAVSGRSRTGVSEVTYNGPISTRERAVTTVRLALVCLNRYWSRGRALLSVESMRGCFARRWGPCYRTGGDSERCATANGAKPPGCAGGPRLIAGDLLLRSRPCSPAGGGPRWLLHLRPANSQRCCSGPISRALLPWSGRVLFGSGRRAPRERFGDVAVVPVRFTWPEHADPLLVPRAVRRDPGWRGAGRGRLVREPSFGTRSLRRFGRENSCGRARVRARSEWPRPHRVRVGFREWALLLRSLSGWMRSRWLGVELWPGSAARCRRRPLGARGVVPRWRRSRCSGL
jgi:hypothetical protein